MEKKIIKTIGVIGAGVMGTGVSFRLSKYGYKVVLIDTNEEILEKAKENLFNIHRFDMMMQMTGKSKPERNKEILSKIECTTDISKLGNIDLIIENVPETFEIKESIYKELSKIVSEDTIVAANTSATSITRLAAYLPYPQNMLGIHFVNPVHLMDTVEMIRGLKTSETVIAIVDQWLADLDMKRILVNDAPGFVSNRVMLTYINEAIFCLAEGIASVQEVDGIFKECLSHKMGPLETADLIGLDTILYSLEMLYNDFNDSKYRPCFLLKQKVYSNELGLKTGKGFYNYTNTIKNERENKELHSE